MRLRRIWLLTLCLWPGSVSADPIRLGEWTSLIHAGSTGTGAVTHQRFTLTTHRIMIPACAGCETLVPVGATGAWDFDDQRAHWFANFLTNRRANGWIYRDDTAYAGATPRDRHVILNRKHVAFGNGQRRSHWQIDFIRLNVLINQIHVNTDHDFRYTALLRWEVWGTGRPEASLTVPAPGASVLLMLGSVIWFARRRAGSPAPPAPQPAGTTG